MMNSETVTEDHWRTQMFRQNMVTKIDEAIRQCGSPTTRSAIEMEGQVFSKAKSKDEYLQFVARLILHIKEMKIKASEEVHNPTQGNPGQTDGQMCSTQNLQMMNRLSYMSAPVAMGGDDDDDIEVDGSFIILANKQNPNSTQNTNSFHEVNVNVFELGQQRSSYHQDEEVIPPSEDQSENQLVADTTVDLTEYSPSTSNAGVVNENLNSVFSNLSCSCSTDSSNGSLEDANAKVLQLLDENRNLKVFVKELNEKQKRFLENCKILESAVAKSQADSQEHEIKYERSRAVIETLRAKNAELELENAKLKTSLAPRQSLDVSRENEIKYLEHEVTEKELQLLDSNQQICDLKELVRKMSAELNEARLSVSMTEPSSLQNERDVLSAAFEESKITIEKLSQRFTEVKAMHEQQVDINATLTRSSKQKSDEIKALTGIVQQLEEQLESQEKEIQNIKKAWDENELISRQKIATLQAEIEDKEVFRAQMEEYKANFEEERRDRVAMKEQKDKLADEVTVLQIRFEELEQNHMELRANGQSETGTETPITSPREITSPINNTSQQPVNNLSQQFSNFYNSLSQNLFGGSTTRASNNGTNSTEGNRQNSEEFTFVPTAEGAGGASAPPQETLFQCPICQKKYETKEGVIHHAAFCGDPARRVFQM